MWSLADLNAMDRAAFCAVLGGIFEHSSWIAESAWARGPFASRTALLAAMKEVLAGAGTERQLALIRAHPDLAGKAAMAGELTRHSRDEQASAGLDRLSAEEFARFQELNRAYRERHGFPFIVCVRLTDKAGIFAAYERRLGNDRATETAEALAQIGEIARLRLEGLVPASWPPVEEGSRWDA
ncbi:MAG: 2-oxo-4-hydroxy-4-carboxy-5-ureidoimidazoline decarboxylase [Alphaproteobacteria bacterium]|nr:2-oxo-4-hydroxy-4-carboxy-5-ureidoimidazoline decarboxylase [Alphaproteobacteria bacterium]